MDFAVGYQVDATSSGGEPIRVLAVVCIQVKSLVGKTDRLYHAFVEEQTAPDPIGDFDCRAAPYMWCGAGCHPDVAEDLSEEVSKMKDPEA